MSTDLHHDPEPKNEPSDIGFDPELEQAVQKAEEVARQAEAAAPYTTPDAASEAQASSSQDPFPYESVPHFGNAPQPEEAQNSETQAPNYTAPQGYDPGAFGQQYYYQPYRPYYPPRYDVPPAGYPQKSRLAAGLLGILFGGLGVHNFYLGFQTKAIIQLLVTLIGSIFTCGASAAAMTIWGFVEGILILTASTPSSYLYDGKGVILRD